MSNGGKTPCFQFADIRRPCIDLDHMNSAPHSAVNSNPNGEHLIRRNRPLRGCGGMGIGPLVIVAGGAFYRPRRAGHSADACAATLGTKTAPITPSAAQVMAHPAAL